MRKLLAIVFVVAALAAAAFAALSGQRVSKSAGPQRSEGDTAAAAKTKARAPVVVELFTSEGCSSCPPADALLARLDKEQPVEGAEIIPLAMHVDYWNQLGWADPFSSSEFSRRQGEYAHAFGEEGVYTPQMIVDGVKEFPGGKSGTALAAIGRAAREPKSEVTLTRGPAQTDEMAQVFVSIDEFPKQTEGDPVYVLLAVTESGLSSDVSRGENSGRRLDHVGVVRVIKRLGVLPDTRGGGFKVETGVMIEKGWRRENLRAVVFAQEGRTRRVLAAGSLKLYG
ncbi:MAG: DUF1223 domain-containing protein [Pyrinomonadaceae bacterium]